MISQRTIDEINSQSERVIGLTTTVKKGKAICLFHEDHDPSVDIDKSEGWICRVCGAGGDAIKWHMKAKRMTFKEAVEDLSNNLGISIERDAPSEVLEKAPPQKMGKPSATYTYCDANGVPLYFVDRFDFVEHGKQKKTFTQRQPNGLKKASDVKVLYRLPQLVTIDDRTVYIVEGEKCADFMMQRGLLATTWSGGAGAAQRTWTPEFAAPLRGRKVILLPDNDDPGRKAMEHAAEALRGIAAEVLTVHLPVVDKKHDVVEWMCAGGTSEELVRLADASRMGSDKWMMKLTRAQRSGKIEATRSNCDIIFENDKEIDCVMRNEFSGKLNIVKECCWSLSTQYPHDLTDPEADRLCVYLSRVYQIEKTKNEVVDLLMAAKWKKSWHPLKAELEETKWDGVKRAEGWLVTYLGAVDSPYIRAIGKKWLIGAIARLYQPGCQMDSVLVLEGTQGVGKSTSLQILAGTNWFNDSIPDLHTKEAQQILSTAWIHEMAELSALTKSDLEKQKAFLTAKVDRFRAAYDKLMTETARTSVFCATTNSDTWNKDITGARRYWPVRVAQVRPVDREALARDRQQIWAEVIEMYKAGHTWVLNQEESIAQREATNDRIAEDPWEYILQPFLRGKAAKKEHVTLHEAMNQLGIPAERQPREQRSVSESLKRSGWVQDRIGRGLDRKRIWMPTSEYLQRMEIEDIDDMWEK